MGLLFTLFSSLELESVDFPHSFVFLLCSFVFLSYNCFSLDLLYLNLFLVDFFDFSWVQTFFWGQSHASNLHDVFIFQNFLSQEKINLFSMLSRECVPFVLEYSQCFKADSRFHLSTQAWFEAVAYLSVCRFCHHNLEASFFTEKGLRICRARPKGRTIMILGMTHLPHHQAKLVSLTRRGTTVNIWPHQWS